MANGTMRPRDKKQREAEWRKAKAKFNGHVGYSPRAIRERHLAGLQPEIQTPRQTSRDLEHVSWMAACARLLGLGWR